MVIWEKYVKKYVWDERSTPFLVPVNKLSQAQAGKELFLFALFLATPFALLSAAAGILALQNSDLGYAIITFYAVSIVTAAGYTHHAKNRNAAIYCGTAPLALMLYFIVNGFGAQRDFLSQAVIIFMILCFLRYTFRIIAITGAYLQLRVDKNPS